MKVKVKLYLSRVAHSAQSLLSIGAPYRQHQQNRKNNEHSVPSTVNFNHEMTTTLNMPSSALASARSVPVSTE